MQEDTQTDQRTNYASKVTSSLLGVVLRSCYIICAKEGFTVSVVKKNIDHDWYQNYCFWQDEINDSTVSAEFQNLFNKSTEKEWQRALVRINRQTRIEIDSSFVKFNTRRFQELLTNTVRTLGVSMYEDTIDNIEHLTTHSISNGKQKYRSRIVVVANGSTRALTYEPHRLVLSNRLWSALRTPRAILTKQQLDLWSLMHHSNKRQFQLFRHSFTLPLSNETIFVEETILATRNPVDWDLLDGLAIRKRLWGFRMLK